MAASSTSAPPRPREKSRGSFQRGFLLGPRGLDGVAPHGWTTGVTPKKGGDGDGDGAARRPRRGGGGDNSSSNTSGGAIRSAPPSRTETDARGGTGTARTTVEPSAGGAAASSDSGEPTTRKVPRGGATTGWTKGFLNPPPSSSSSSLPFSSSPQNKKRASAIKSKTTPRRLLKTAVSQDLLEIDDALSGRIPSCAKRTPTTATSTATATRSPWLDVTLVPNVVRSGRGDDDDDGGNSTIGAAGRPPLIRVLCEEDEEDGGDGTPPPAVSAGGAAGMATFPQTQPLVALRPDHAKKGGIHALATTTTTATTATASHDGSSCDVLWKEVATTRRGASLLGPTKVGGTVPLVSLVVGPTTGQPSAPHDGARRDAMVAGGGAHGGAAAGLFTDCTFDSVLGAGADPPGCCDGWREPPHDSETPPLPPAPSGTSASSSPPSPSARSATTPSDSLMEFQQELERLVGKRGTVLGREFRAGSNEHPQTIQTSHWTVPQARWAWKFCLLQQGMLRQDPQSDRSLSASRKGQFRAMDDIAASLVLSHPDGLRWMLEQREAVDDRRGALQAALWLKRSLPGSSKTEHGAGMQVPGQKGNRTALPPPLPWHVCSVLLPPLVDLAVQPQRTMLAQTAWEAAILCVGNWMDGTFQTGSNSKASDVVPTEMAWGHLQTLLNQQLAWQKSKGKATTSTSNRIDQLNVLRSKCEKVKGATRTGGDRDDRDHALTLAELARDLKQLVHR